MHFQPLIQEVQVLQPLGTISSGTWQGSAIGNSYINWSSPGDIGLTVPKSASFTTVNISNIINLVPQSRPLSPNNGDIYIDSGDNHIYCYVNG